MISERCTIEEYHADTQWVTNSMRETFRDSPCAYRNRYITKTEPAREPTDEQVLGQMVDCLLTEPESYKDRFWVAQGCERRGTKAWDDAVEDAREAGFTGTVVLRKKDATAKGIVEAAFENPDVREVFAGGEAQRTVFWTWAPGEIEVPCKCRPDWLPADGTVVEVKTTCQAVSDRDMLMRDAEKYGYHRQCFYYLLGCVENGIVPRVSCENFSYVFLSTTGRPEAIVVKPTEDYVRLGELEATRDMAALAERMASGDWSCLKDERRLDLTWWAKRRLRELEAV